MRYSIAPPNLDPIWKPDYWRRQLMGLFFTGSILALLIDTVAYWLPALEATMHVVDVAGRACLAHWQPITLAVVAVWATIAAIGGRR